MSTCYVVLGPAKSGTSLTAGLLSKLGVWFGNNLKTGGANPEYYEDWDLIHYLRDGIGSPQRIVKRLSLNGTCPKWGMKMPRLSFQWDAFSPHISEPKFVVTYRNPQSNAASYVRQVQRDKTEEEARQIILDNYTAINQFATHDRLNVWFEDWFNDELQLERLAGFVGLPVTQQAREFIKPDLKHF